MQRVPIVLRAVSKFCPCFTLKTAQQVEKVVCKLNTVMHCSHVTKSTIVTANNAPERESGQTFCMDVRQNYQMPSGISSS